MTDLPPLIFKNKNPTAARRKVAADWAIANARIGGMELDAAGHKLIMDYVDGSITEDEMIQQALSGPAGHK